MVKIELTCQTVTDSLQKEGKPQIIIIKEAGCSESNFQVY